jgi:hypothetical protein
MKKIVLLLSFLGPLLVPASLPADDSAREGRLTNVTGKVYLRSKNLSAAEWVEAEKDTPIDEGDTIRTEAGSTAEVTLDGDSVVLLNENTELKADALTRAKTRFFLALGSLTAKIRKLTEPDQRFDFKTPVAVAAVRGTELAVTYDGEEAPAVIGVFDEGQVAVESEGHDDVIVNAGEETEVTKTDRPLPPRPLAKLLVNRPNIVHVRERVQFIKPQWKPIPVRERQMFRARLLEKPRLQFQRPERLPRRERPNRPARPERPPRRDRR